ncbi:MAG: hypothetical protein ACRERC_10040, partial [Candidatus Binatia bacterium]
MKDQVLGFIDALRQAGLRPSVSESLDAARAVAAAGVARSVLREALAATLVKDAGERATFDDIFDRYFALPVHPAAARRRPAPSEGEGAGRGGDGEGRGPQPEGAAGRGAAERQEPRAGDDPERR